MIEDIALKKESTSFCTRRECINETESCTVSMSITWYQYDCLLEYYIRRH